TGPITRNMATAVLKTYEAVPSPKLVVAAGACGCSGGIFDRRNCAVGSRPNSNEDIVGPVDSLLPVDGYIPGCPPTPAMLVSGIGIGRLMSGRLSDDQRRGAGLALALDGALTTIPLAIGIIQKNESGEEMLRAA